MSRRLQRRAKGIPRTPMEFPVPQPVTPLLGDVVEITFDSWQQAAIGMGHPALLKLFRTFGLYHVKPKRTSRGVVWRNRAYWWSEKGYYRAGKTGELRAPLQHLIWAHHHRRPKPPGHEIFFRDRDRHNFTPGNLELLSKSAMHKRILEIGEGREISPEQRRQMVEKRWSRVSKQTTSVLLSRFNSGRADSLAAGAKHQFIQEVQSQYNQQRKKS